MTSQRNNLETNKNTQAPTPIKHRRLKESWEWLKEFWGEFKQMKYGILGLIFFVLFIGIVVFEPVLIPFKDTNTKWNDITYWDDNPRSAAPVWTNWFSTKDKTPHKVIKNPNVEVKDVSSMKIVEATFDYNYKYDIPPTDLNFRAHANGIINLSVDLVRPDGEKIQLAKKSIRSTNGKNVKISLGAEGLYKTYEFVKKHEDPAFANELSRTTITTIEPVFAKAQPGIFTSPEPLEGKYQIHLTAAVMGKDAALEDMQVIVAGRVFGVMGTDSSKRDIWSGVIVGTKWALLIGLLTSFVAVVIGVTYGVTSAYFGGWVDSLMMRIWEVFISIPMLPVLIVISAVFKPSIWSLILLMCAFYWRGSVRTVRSIGLQIKEETYVEAARALNASHGRIVFKHMIPQLVPYAFASMALMVPGAIVAEASISLLGLGDATIVTWGQILQDAVNGGAVLQGIWWWIVPPGLFIAFMGMTFAFIGFAMDTILNPKLKSR